MKFAEFKQYHPKQSSNVFGFICEDDFLLEESRPVWKRIFGGGPKGEPDRAKQQENWVFEKFPAKEFEEIPAGRLMDDALTPSLFTQNRVLIVANAEKTTKGRLEDLE